MSNPLMLVYLPYAAIAITLTIWLARTLSRHGEVFLKTVFPDREDLAHAVNQLLVIGFYLVNLGWALLLLHGNSDEAAHPVDAVVLLSEKLGLLLLLLGVAHMGNLFVFHKIRSGNRTPKAV
ncbi:MAG TPA: hypothetical protein VLX92_12630 [Kofleriaceae bacterium]|nr:hypothetical protein [Kofleriaceae bacterium]